MSYWLYYCFACNLQLQFYGGMLLVALHSSYRV